MMIPRTAWRAVWRGYDFGRRQGWGHFFGRLVRPWRWVPTLLWDARAVNAAQRAASAEAHRWSPEDDAAPCTATRFLHALDRTLPYGLNVSGYLQSEKGLGEAARLMVRAARARGIPLVLNSVFAPGARNTEVDRSSLSEENPYFFNLICLNGGEIPGFVLERGERYLQGRYNIALWHWELREFPAYWLDSFRYVNEVWVPARFIQDCVARVAPVPVVRIPLAAAAVPGDSAGLSRADLGLGEGQFVVLSVFDFHGVVERKNPFGLIEAFRRAFGEEDGAVMLLKCTNASYFPRERKALERAADGLNVRFLDEVMDRAHLNDLYSLSDCYLSLHRGEGFGLTITEAMLAGKPVIATGFGGNADFMCAENSYLVPYRLVEIPRDWFPYPKGGVWAEPDLDAAADLLRRVRQHPAEAATKGAQARATALREFAPERIGGLMEERLGAVARVLDFPGWPGEGQATGP